MKDDPIVDEVRKAGEEYFAQFNFDLRAICEDLRRQSEERGVRPVTLPPRPAQLAQPPTARKVS